MLNLLTLGVAGDALWLEWSDKEDLDLVDMMEGAGCGCREEKEELEWLEKGAKGGFARKMLTFVRECVCL